MPLLRQLKERMSQTWEASRRRQYSILARFVAEAERAGAVVREVVDPQAVGFSIAALAKAQRVTLCHAADRDLARELNLQAALTEAGISLATGPNPDGIVHAGIGVTRATAGVAETGSILVHLDEIDARLLGMLPEIHVALLYLDTVVDSLEEGLLVTRYLTLRSSRERRPSYCSWVTGPSRTADIERVLTIGVHGPRQLHVFVLPPTGKGIGS
jgi:L-lactate dehydrogenase complex protein LldG